MLNSQTTLSLAMLLFLVLPVLVWLTLPRQAHWEVDLWCLGNLIAGVGIVLLGMRSKLPVVVSFHLANTLILSCFLCCSQSLRMTLGHDWRWRGLALRMFMAFVFYSVLFEWAAEAWRGVLYRLVLGFLSISTAYWAWRMYRNKDSLNAAAMALAYLVVGLSLTAHSLWTAGHIVESSPFSNTWDASVISLVVLLMTVVTNLCYMGMVLDLAARESLLSQRAQQAARDTELLEAQLRRLERRGRISIISGSLAHELNQPLTAATMNAQLAQRQWATHPVSSPMLLELLAQVEAGVDRTARILQRIRDGNAVVAQPHEQVDLQAILDRTLAQMALKYNACRSR